MANNPSEHLFNQANQLYTSQSATSNTQVFDTVQNPENLYVYSMGLREIDIKSIQYTETEAFVSKPFQIPGNVMEIELETEETHPLFDEIGGRAAGTQTSIEYYISHKSRPNVSDWYPILPQGTKEVISERLFPNSNGIATLRFPAKLSTIVCYANGLKLADGLMTTLSEQTIQLNQLNKDTIYTVNYTPDSYRQNPYVFELDSVKKDVVRHIETFEKGTAFNKTVTLSHYPYIDLNTILKEDDYNPNTSDYKPVEVYLKNATLQGERNSLIKEVQPYSPDSTLPYTYNRTYYQDKTWSQMNNYDLAGTPPYLGFDYYQFKNKLTFTEHFNAQPLEQNLPYSHGNASIEVHYDTLMTEFRLKIILRRNTAAETMVTPKVNAFRLKFKTIE